MVKRRRNIFIAACLAPALILFGVFVIYPVIQGFILSFYRWSGLTRGTEVFIGFGNFETLFQDHIFWKALVNNLILLMVVPPVTMMLAMSFAYFITNRNLKESGFFKVVYYFPNVMSVVAISVMWSFVYNPNRGILNAALKSVGLDHLAAPWLGDPSTALFSVAATMIWATLGGYMLLYVAAMQRIPNDLYEAARIDGANAFKQFTKLTFPLIIDVTRISIIFFFTNVFNNGFTYVRVMTPGGGPNHATQILGSYMYFQAFERFNLGYATAIALFMFILLLILSLISNFITKREQVTY